MAIEFLGHGTNVVGSLGSGSLVQNMPSAYSFGTADTSTAGSFVNCGDETEFEFANAEGFILAAWVKMAKFSDHQFIAGKSNWAGTSHSEYFLGMNNDGRFHWVCNNGTNGGTCQSDDVYNNAVEKEGWYHIMGVRDTSNDLTLYINGVAQADTETCTGSIGVSSRVFGIGTRNDGGTPDLLGDYWRGNIRDVRIYSGTATAPELQDIFVDTNCTGVTLAGGSTVGWWKMGGDFDDSSTNSNNGVLTTGAASTDYWDKSIYNLNQIGSGSVSGATTVSGGTWNLRDSTYLDFDGVDDFMSMDSLVTLGTEFYVGMVVQAIAGESEANATFLGGDGGGGGNRFFLNTSDSSVAYRNSNSNFTTSLTSSGTDVELISYTAASSHFTTSLNGTEDVDAVISGNMAARYIGGGTVFNMSAHFNELIIYDSDQSANRAAIETNINNHYDIY